MTFIMILTILVSVTAALSFFLLPSRESAVSGLIVSIFLFPLFVLASMGLGTNEGRSMELCDQAGGVYSLWTNECTTPTEVIELETGDE